MYIEYEIWDGSRMVGYPKVDIHAVSCQMCKGTGRAENLFKQIKCPMCKGTGTMGTEIKMTQGFRIPAQL